MREEEPKRKRFLEWTKYDRVHGYLLTLIHEHKLPTLQEDAVHELFHEFMKYYYRYKSLSLIRMILFAVLYGSIISAVSSQIPVISELINTILSITAVIGTTLSLILILLINQYIDRIAGDLNVLSSHIIAYYTVHATKKKKIKAD